MFTKKEVIALLISILIFAFIFGFDDGRQTFNASYWLANLFTIAIIVAISLLVRELVIKFFAKRHEAESQYKIWQMEYLWFDKKVKLIRPLPFGIIISLILAVYSKGTFFFTAIGKHDLILNKSVRVGRQRINLKYFEEAQIISTGIVASLFLSIIVLLFGRLTNTDFSRFVNINFYLALFNMIPFSSLDGAKIFFGSLTLYLFMAIFVIGAFLLIQLNVIIALLVAFLIASVIAIIYFLKGNDLF